jgi:hypothetical protein
MLDTLYSGPDELELGEGIGVKWLYGRRLIVIYRNTLNKVTSRKQVDVYMNLLKTLLTTWDVQIPYLVLSDFRGGMLTPYSRGRAEDLVKYVPPNLKGRVAILLDNASTSILINLIVRQLAARSPAQIENRVFSSYDYALRWLEELIPNELKTQPPSV